jgi:phosphoenolpyruvate-protein kinase (PTS system EI component)
LEGEYFQARAVDVRDVGLRLVAVLQNKPFKPQLSLSKPSVILAKDLTPSDTVQLDKTMVLGFCTVEGGETSHTAILARSLGLAAVVGCPIDILEIPNDSLVILDGSQGKLYVDPDKALLDEYPKNLKLPWA